MRTKVIDLARALLTFRNRVENLLIAEGARLLSDGVFLLESAGGPLRVAIDGRWVIGHFASPLGGYTATKHSSDPHTGKWVDRCPGTVQAFTGPLATDDLAEMLDRVLAFKPTGRDRMLIDLELREQRRHILRMYEVFAAVPDPDAPKHEGAEPPLGKLIMAGVDPAKPGKDKTVKAAAKRTAAKDAKPNVAAELRNARPVTNRPTPTRPYPGTRNER